MDLETLKTLAPWEWPPKAGETLRKVLKGSASEETRAEAAQLAGDLVVMSDEMAEVLLKIVASADQPDIVRARAAISMGPALDEIDMMGFDDDMDDPAISEEMYHQTQETFHAVFFDESTPKEVRRRVLEASVRAPQDWHKDAILAADSNKDPDWKLTAIFCMRWVPGFDARILESLSSTNPQILYEAVCAAGSRGLSAAWPRIAGLVNSRKTEKRLRLAAIEAAPGIDSRKALALLSELEDSKDPDIAEAVEEALLMADTTPDEDEDDEAEDEGTSPGPSHLT